MSGHLGTELPALVDGELGHAARERGLAHLANCADCRCEVEAHRRLKARLSGAGGPPPPVGLVDRLLALPAEALPVAPLPVDGLPMSATAPVDGPGSTGPRRTEVAGDRTRRERRAGRTVGGSQAGVSASRRRRAGADRGPGRSAGRDRPRGRVRTHGAALGGAVLAAGLGVVLALGAPPSGTRPAVDPASDAFLVDHAGSTSVLPLADPVGVMSASLTR